MKVIVFGSTGTIGRHLLSQALDQGHEVTAFCRDAQNLNGLQHPNLQVAVGNVLEPADVARALQGQEAVIVCLGSGKSRKSTIRSAGTRVVISEMQRAGLKRLICQTTLGNGDSRHNLNFFWKHIMFGWYLKQVYLDHELQERLVMQSQLDWTIVRPSAFTDGPHTKQYLHGFSPEDRRISLKISRADVADFLLRQLDSVRYLHQTPGLSY